MINSLSPCFYGNTAARRRDEGEPCSLPTLFFPSKNGRTEAERRSRENKKKKNREEKWRETGRKRERRARKDGVRETTGVSETGRVRKGRAGRSHALVQNGVSMVTSAGYQKIEAPSVCLNSPLPI